MKIPSRFQAFSLSITIFCLDFLTKRLVLSHIPDFSDGIPLIPGLLRFTYVRNAGAAFGMFQGNRWPFVVVSSLAVIFLVWILLKGRPSHWMRRASYALILAGAAGNLIDRIFYDGRVVDFIEMSYHGHIFPVYNVADMSVSFGAAFLILSMLREGKNEVAPPVQAPGLDGEHLPEEGFQDHSSSEANGSEDAHEERLS